MSDLLEPLYVITVIAISQIVVEWFIYRRVSWLFPSLVLGLWGILGLIQIADRFGWLPETESPEEWLYDKHIESWFVNYATFGAFWDMNEKEIKARMSGEDGR